MKRFDWNGDGRKTRQDEALHEELFGLHDRENTPREKHGKAVQLICGLAALMIVILLFKIIL